MMNRRDFLALSAASAASVALPRSALAGDGGWRYRKAVPE
jgi:hypothetical protein